MKSAYVGCVPIPSEPPPPPPACPLPKEAGKHVNMGQIMLYIPWMVILRDHNIKKISLEITIFELPNVKNCISRLRTGPFTGPLLVETVISHCWHGV